MKWRLGCMLELERGPCTNNTSDVGTYCSPQFSFTITYPLRWFHACFKYNILLVVRIEFIHAMIGIYYSKNYSCGFSPDSFPSVKTSLSSTSFLSAGSS